MGREDAMQIPPASSKAGRKRYTSLPKAHRARASRGKRARRRPLVARYTASPRKGERRIPAIRSSRKHAADARRKPPERRAFSRGEP
jgi:hypothetical protein